MLSLQLRQYERVAAHINSSVERLRELDPELAPPRSLALTADDFE